jgi:hypothetical protein
MVKTKGNEKQAKKIVLNVVKEIEVAKSGIKPKIALVRNPDGTMRTVEY